MKTRCWLWLLAGLVSGLPLRADDPPPSAPAAPATLDSFAAPLAPANVPFKPIVPVQAPGDVSAVDLLQAQQAARAAKDKVPDSIVELEKAARAKAAEDENWLLRGYQQQLQSRSLTESLPTPSTDFYSHMAGNQDLARLAGIKTLTPDDKNVLDPARDMLKTDGASASTNPKGVNLRPDDSQNKADKPKTFFKPLITPLSAPDVAGLNNFYASLPTVTTNAGADTPPANGLDALSTALADKGHGTTSSDPDHGLPAFSDIPGQIAAGGIPGADKDNALPTMEITAGGEVTSYGSRGNKFTVDTLPSMTVNSQLQNQKSLQLATPVAPSRLTPPTISPLLTNPSLDVKPPPATTLPSNSAHSKVSDPFDILNR